MRPCVDMFDDSVTQQPYQCNNRSFYTRNYIVEHENLQKTKFIRYVRVFTITKSPICVGLFTQSCAQIDTINLRSSLLLIKNRIYEYLPTFYRFHGALISSLKALLLQIHSPSGRKVWRLLPCSSTITAVNNNSVEGFGRHC